MENDSEWSSASSQFIFGEHVLSEFERLLFGKVHVPTLFWLDRHTLTAYREAFTVT